jgi:DNA-binding transcriptional regulator GbsR (MarR family)
VSDLARAVERLGQTLESTGIPRMPARVFAFVLADDRSAYTAAELASGLQVSTAAISGAVRYLTDSHLVVRERNPAGRGDLFRVRDGDIWGTIQAARLPMLDRVIQSVQQAVELLPPGSAGRERVEETRDYFTFIREDNRGLDERWRAWRQARSVAVGEGAGGESPR